tara:strand:- start:278 stop:562 length:285 start_codon:yes stop_codon:yes gene_type:complete
MSVNKIKDILEESFNDSIEDSDIEKIDLEDNTNILDEIDSFAVVSFLLEAEMNLEAEFGKYISLANEDLFDKSKSVLNSWSDFVNHVAEIHKQI